MSDSIKDTSKKTVQAKSSTKALLVKRFGSDVMAEGFSAIPSIAFKTQSRLGLNNNEMMVLFHLYDHWIGTDSSIFPTIRTIAERMNLSISRVRFYLKQLEDGGFLKRYERYVNGAQKANEYNLNGFVEKIMKFGPEYAEARAKKEKTSQRLQKRKNPKVKNAEAEVS